jgi:Xaa-Pro aminopeptidase
MSRAGVDLYVVPSSDPHQSEYIPLCWARRIYVSGFTGSAGELLVGQEGAWLWTDSRYWIQAEAQLDTSGVELMRDGAPGVDDLNEWLTRNAAGRALGVDPLLVSVKRSRKLARAVEASGGALTSVEENLVDRIWEDQPPPPLEAVTVLDETIAGESVPSKLSRVREKLSASSSHALVVTALDAIAWLFNLRGRDVPFNPIVVAYALVDRDGARLFVVPEKLDASVRSHLADSGVHIEGYDDFGPALREQEGQVCLDADSTSLWVLHQLTAGGARVYEAPNPIMKLKAVKNSAECEGMRAAHRRDAVAVVRFLHWLENAWQEGGLNELTAAQHLDAFRREGGRFRDLAFTTISAFGPNGALPHYMVKPEEARTIDDSNLYLVDSGGQYLDGTTDITRTVHLGTPQRVERERYTAVLRGHLALRHTVFPEGTTGAQLDAVARRPIWEAGFDYGHGTGHGVGSYLNVHERPPVLSPKAPTDPIEPGMVLSNEPGIYLAGRYGIRIENLLLVTEAEHGEERAFRGFEDLTLVPYCRKLIEPELLSEAEREAVNRYHVQVREAISPLLPRGAADWLEQETAPL